MIDKRARLRTAILLSAILVIVGLVAVFALLDDNRPPRLPTTSKRSTLTLTSNGCCFWVEDVDVTLLTDGGEAIPLAHHDKLFEDDIHRHALPDSVEGPVQLMVSFRAFYADTADFALPVMAFEDLDALKKTGVLLYFQEYDDVYLNVIAGTYHASYRMGSEENRWALMDTPNTVYGRD